MLVYGLAELSWVYLGLVDMLAAIPRNTQAWKTTFQPQRQGYSRGTAPHLATPSLRFVEIVTGGHGKLWVTAKEDAQIFQHSKPVGFDPCGGNFGIGKLLHPNDVLWSKIVKWMSGIFKTALLKQLKFQHAPDFFPSATSKTAAIFFGASYILKMPSHQIKEANVVLLPLLAQILTSLEMMEMKLQKSAMKLPDWMASCGRMGLKTELPFGGVPCDVPVKSCLRETRTNINWLTFGMVLAVSKPLFLAWDMAWLWYQNVLFLLLSVWQSQ